MPLEIKEIVVTASVTESFMDEKAQNSGSGGGANGNSNSEDLIAACVEQVLEILREKNER